MEKGSWWSKVLIIELYLFFIIISLTFAKRTTMNKKEKKKLKYIARENMKDLLTEANEREIDPKSIVQIVVKGNTLNLVYAE